MIFAIESLALKRAGLISKCVLNRERRLKKPPHILQIIKKKILAKRRIFFGMPKCGLAKHLPLTNSPKKWAGQEYW